jgi:hypothetical protein
MEEPVISIRTAREKRPISGADTAIATMPQALYADIGGEKTLLLRKLGVFLRNQSEQFAADIGEELHHAEWVITTSPATVQARGQLHDCEKCRAGVRAALRKLRENPGEELLVGTLYWAGSEKPTVIL